MTDTRIFPHSQWDALLAAQIDRIKALARLKGGEYAGDQDRLANFRRNAEAVALPMEVVWRIYAGKHWDAITQFVQDLGQGKVRQRAEPISGRVDDMIVYLLLLQAMLQEREGPKDRRAEKLPQAKLYEDQFMERP